MRHIQLFICVGTIHSSSTSIALEIIDGAIRHISQGYRSVSHMETFINNRCLLDIELLLSLGELSISLSELLFSLSELLVSLSELSISLSELLVSLSELLISLSELLISLSELLISMR